MKSRLYVMLSITSLYLCFSCIHDAQAGTVSITTQNTADFTGSGPTTSFNPAWVAAESTFTALQTGSVPDVYRSPFENYATPGFGIGGWATLSYTSIQAGGTAVYNIPTGGIGLSLLWGSPDSYNTLTFYSGLNGTGTDLGSFTGSDLKIQTYGHDLVTFLSSSTLFESLVLTSGSNAFEFADLSVSSDPGPGGFGATPLPAALPLFVGGLGLYGLLARRRKRRTAG